MQLLINFHFINSWRNEQQTLSYRRRKSNINNNFEKGRKQTDGRTEIQTDGLTDGQKDRQKDRQTKTKTVFKLSPFSIRNLEKYLTCHFRRINYQY
jgi:hypothetical protein